MREDALECWWDLLPLSSGEELRRLGFRSVFLHSAANPGPSRSVLRFAVCFKITTVESNRTKERLFPQRLIRMSFNQLRSIAAVAVVCSEVCKYSIV